MNYHNQIHDMNARLKRMMVLRDQLYRDWKAMEAEFGDQSTMANYAFNAWEDMSHATNKYSLVVGKLERDHEKG